jgi:lipopolysaccharide biosynthesis glycosyltransferase
MPNTFRNARTIRPVVGDRRQIAGVFDYVDPGSGLRGWLVHPAVAALPLWVEAWCGDQKLASSVTLLDRPDIDRLVKRRSYSGYLIGWSRFDRTRLARIAETTPEALIDVRVAGAGLALPASQTLTAYEAHRMLLGAPRGDQRSDFALLNTWLEIEASGLFDARWYHRRYGKSFSEDRSALQHYITEGEALGHRPNLYFDPAFYAAHQGLEPGEMALLHYLRRQHGTRDVPSPHFDNRWYREFYGIDTTVSALAHHLAHRRVTWPNGVTEPRPVDASGIDPYERFLAKLARGPNETHPACKAIQEDARALFAPEPVAEIAPQAEVSAAPGEGLAGVASLADLRQRDPLAEPALAALIAGAQAMEDPAQTTIAARQLLQGIEPIARLEDHPVAREIMDWVNAHWFSADRTALLPLLQALQKRGMQGATALIRLVESAVDAGDVLAGAAYAEALHKAFPEAERDWALLGLARLRRLQGDQEAARALLCRIEPSADAALLAIGATLLIEIGAFDEARMRLDAVRDQKHRLLEQARLRLAIHSRDFPEASAILGRVAIGEIDDWVLSEAIYRTVVPGVALEPGQAETEDRLIDALALRTDGNENVIATLMFALLQRRRLTELGDLFDHVADEPISQTMSLRIRKLEYLGLVGRTEEALALLRDEMHGVSFGKWEGLSVMRLLSETKQWQEAGALVLDHIRQGFGFGATPHAAMRVVRKARLHDDVAELISSGRIAATVEPELTKFLHLVQEDHTLVQSARALSGQGMVPARSLRGMNGNWILDGTIARDEDKSGLFLCTNRRYFLSLLTYLCSFYGQSQQVAVHTYVFLDRDVPRHWYSAVTMVAARFNRVIEIVHEDDFMPAGVEHKAEYGFFAGGSGLSRAAYFRLYAARWMMDLNRFTRALYVDTDIICRGDLGDLVNMDLGGAALAARIEDMGPEVQKAADRNGLVAARFFNSGVLVLDFAHPDLRRRIEVSIGLSEFEPDRLVFHDQCALNIAFTDCFQPLEPRWNFFLRPHRERNGHIEDGMLLHYLDKPKPWDIVFSRNYREEWRVWAVHLGMILPQPLYIDVFAAANEE